MLISELAFTIRFEIGQLLGKKEEEINANLGKNLIYIGIFCNPANLVPFKEKQQTNGFQLKSKIAKMIDIC
ncbi:hypothetical protein TrispH2_011954 [Trichoplax sp. H2]|nr:hypothetical protein TrispH2_011954 [Trichoplax sp. H2]|eukprot:RDD36225.1 hypothetical protein TrispH2_011954 [Trichoplax sp. H2]